MTGVVRIQYGRRPGCPGTAHGTACAYHRHGCRCADAREEYLRVKRGQRSRRPRTGLGVPPARHADVDEVAVDRACAGYGGLGGLGVAERLEVVRRLTAAGMSAQGIGAHVGLSARVVQRYRARARQEGGARRE